MKPIIETKSVKAEPVFTKWVSSVTIKEPSRCFIKPFKRWKICLQSRQQSIPNRQQRVCHHRYFQVSASAYFLICSCSATVICHTIVSTYIDNIGNNNQQISLPIISAEKYLQTMSKLSYQMTAEKMLRDAHAKGVFYCKQVCLKYRCQHGLNPRKRDFIPRVTLPFSWYKASLRTYAVCRHSLYRMQKKYTATVGIKLAKVYRANGAFTTYFKYTRKKGACILKIGQRA